jgi:hypothetical protein
MKAHKAAYKRPSSVVQKRSLQAIREENDEFSGGTECVKCEKPKRRRPSREPSAINGSVVTLGPTVVDANNNKLEFKFEEQSLTTRLGLLSYIFHLIIDSNGIFKQIDTEMVKYSKEIDMLANRAHSVDEVRAFVKKSLARNREINQLARNRLRALNEEKMNTRRPGGEDMASQQKLQVNTEVIDSIDLSSIQAELVGRIKELKAKLTKLSQFDESSDQVCECDAI